MNDLSLTEQESTFLKKLNGFFDNKRNMIIILTQQWDKIQKELESYLKQKIENEEEFNAKEKEIIAKIYNADYSTKSDENQLQERLARIQNEEVSLQLRIKQNDKEPLVRKYNQNEEKIKNEKKNQSYFLNQSRVAMENKIEQLNKLKVLEDEERRLNKILTELNEEIVDVYANEKKREDLCQIESKQRRTILENRIEELENKIKKVNCVLCNNNPSNVFFDTCKHLGCCGDCIANKFRNNKTSSELLCPICNSVNTQSYQIMIP